MDLGTQFIVENAKAGFITWRMKPAKRATES
jgi:hypothetical protein